MHPFDGLFSGREMVDAVGLAEDVLGLFEGARGCQVPRRWTSGI